MILITIIIIIITIMIIMMMILIMLKMMMIMMMMMITIIIKDLFLQKLLSDASLCGDQKTVQMYKELKASATKSGKTDHFDE